MMATSTYSRTEVSLHKSLSEKSCCSKKQHKTSKETTSKSCCKGQCNPFMSCCGFCSLVSEVKIELLGDIVQERNFSTKADKLFVRYLSSAWHPPQLV